MSDQSGRVLPPVRLCCATRHYGPVCPDGTFMCVGCFETVALADAYVAPDSQAWDVCKTCGPKTAPARTPS